MPGWFIALCAVIGYGILAGITKGFGLWLKRAVAEEINTRIGDSAAVGIWLALRFVPKHRRPDMGDEWAHQLEMLNTEYDGKPLARIPRASWFCLALIARGILIRRERPERPERQAIQPNPSPPRIVEPVPQWPPSMRINRTRVPKHIRSREVVHNLEQSKFEAYADGDLVGVLGYSLSQESSGQVLTILHTVLYDEYTGHGFTTSLTKAAIEYVVEHGMKIRPVCSFTQHYLRTHPGQPPRKDF